MNINELKLQRTSKINEMDVLNKTANESKRSMNEDEVLKWDTLRAEVENLDIEIKRAETQDELNRSIIEKDNNKEENINLNMKENKRQLIDYVSESMRNDGNIENFKIESKRHSITDASGAVEVGVSDLSVIGKKPIWREMGVKHFPNLTKSFKLPYISPSVSGKKGEGAVADANGKTLGNIEFSPARYTVWDTFSKELLSVGNEAVVAGIIEDLIEGAERKVTADVYTVAEAIAVESTGSTAISLSSFNKLQAAVDADGGYLMPRSMFYTAKDTELSNGTAKYLVEKVTNEKGNLSDGTPVFYSNLFEGSQVVYGNLNSIAVGEWGYDVTFDTITLADKGEVKVTVAKLANVKARNPYAFSKTKI